MFRVAFSMERMVPNTLTGSFNAAYLRNLTGNALQHETSISKFGG